MTNKTFLKLAGKSVLYILLFVLLSLAAALIFITDSYGKGIARRSLQTSPYQAKPHQQGLPGNPFLPGNAVNDTIPFSFIKKDTGNVERYFINGVFIVDGRNVSFLLNDSLLLNYKKWNVSPGNRISYTPAGILVTNFSLSNDSSTITVTNQQNLAGSPIELTVRNFNISDLTGLANKDSSFASGLLNIKITAGEFTRKFPAITATALIGNLALMHQPVGNIALKAQMADKYTIHTTLELEENGNDVSGNGSICVNEGPLQVDALLNIKTLQLTAIQGLVKNIMNLASGSVNGLIALKGKFTRPQWTGTINFDTTRFTLNKFGSTYTIDKQQSLLNYPAISLNHFIIKDTLDNELVMNGNICPKAGKAYDLDIDLNSHDFTLINAPKAINNQFYGYARVDANVSISGSSVKPQIKGSVHLNEKTALTLVLPEKNIDKDAASSVVRFIDRNRFALPEKRAFNPAADTGINFKQYLNYNLDIQVDKQAALTIVIDPSTGDELRVKGDAHLNAGLDTGKNPLIDGIYHLDSGYYELSYQFLRKRFNLVQGSAINFRGGPKDAQINIKAEYIANTAPKDLLGNEVGSVDPAIANSFNQKIPFRVILVLTGSLKKPAISFDIRLPADNAISRELRTTIENKLVQLRGDIAATNKQVFALLVLDRFVGEQSSDYFKGNGGNFSDITKESVSKFLSAALDQLASDLFKGINVDLNLNSFKDFSNNDGAQKSDLNVEVSKNFLNDRLSVSVGRNFGIESQDASTKAAQQKASRFLPDVTVNYKLSADGRYMFRSYKKTPFEVVLDGYVVETGLAFIVTMDYEMFNEIFYKKNKKQPNSR